MFGIFEIIIVSVIAAIIMIIYYLLRGKPVVVPTMTLGSDQASYTTGESVILSGKVTSDGSPLASKNVAISISPPSGDAYSLPVVVTDANGDFQATWTVPSDAVAGTYTADGTSEGASATATFKSRRRRGRTKS